MPAANRYTSFNANESATKLRAITPHATDELEFVTAGLLCTVAGNVSVIAVDDTDPVTIPVLAGVVYPIRVKAVRTSGTTATVIALVN